MGIIGKQRNLGSKTPFQSSLVQYLLAQLESALCCEAEFCDNYLHALAPAQGLSELSLQLGPFASANMSPDNHVLAFNASSPQRSSSSSGDGSPEQTGSSTTPRRKFKCDLCTSTFSRKDNLKTHQRIHSGEKPFKCRYCDRQFMWQSSARTHELTHQRSGRTRRIQQPHAGASVMPRNQEVSTEVQPFSSESFMQGSCPSLVPSSSASVSQEHPGSAASVHTVSNPFASPGADMAISSRHFGMPRDTPTSNQPVPVNQVPNPAGTSSEGFVALRMRPSEQNIGVMQPRQGDTVPERDRAMCPDPRMTQLHQPVYSYPPAYPAQVHVDVANRGSRSSAVVNPPFHASQPADFTMSRNSRVAAATAAMLSLDELIEGAPQSHDESVQVPATPQGEGESPMFAGTRLSQHDLERHMEDLTGSLKDSSEHDPGEQDL